ncbi:MAG: flagellar hook-associated protein FlgK [Gammaproteobacteria bacterium]
MVDILRTGLSGLLAFQQALATTSHNVANASTPGFSRQQVKLSAFAPQPYGGYLIGRGVDVVGVKRNYDDFVTRQVRQYSASHGESETVNGLVGQLSGLLGNADAGITRDMEQFFGAIQDLADEPSSTPVRQVLLTRAQSMTSRFQEMNRQFTELRDSVNRGIQDTVGEINQLAEAIAADNRDLVRMQASGATPNDLLDHRDQLLADLSARVAVQTVVQSDGSMNVYIGSGQNLVTGIKALPLETASSQADPQRLTIRQQGQGDSSDLSSQLSGGKLGGQLAFRNEILDPAQNHLGLLAVGLAETFNAQHHQGMDLNGQLGGDFFTLGAPRIIANDANNGTAALTIAINDVSQMQASDYEVRFDGAAYSVLRLTDNKVVASGASSPISVDGFTIDLASGAPAAGDRFLLQPTRQAAAGFEVALAGTADIAAAAPIRTGAAQTNIGSGRISAGAVTDASNPNLRRAVEIRFTSASSFDVIDTATNTALASAQPYTNNDPIAFNGWEVKISGTPQAGDSFQVTDNAGGIGDSRNALAMGKLQSAQTLLNGTSDYHGVYAQMVAEVGAQGARSENAMNSQAALLDQSIQARESVAGVNLDEEAADLLRFQQAYSASAQIIRVADSLFQTLMDATRR